MGPGDTSQNVARHLRLAHTTYQCFWRCPVPCCPMRFASELKGKDHLERIHLFTEGRGYSFYDCLRQFRLEWFSRRSFFDQRDTIRPARRCGWISHSHVNPARNSIMTTSSPPALPSEISGSSSARQSGSLSMHISTTHDLE